MDGGPGGWGSTSLPKNDFCFTRRSNRDGGPLLRCVSLDS